MKEIKEDDDIKAIKKFISERFTITDSINDFISDKVESFNIGKLRDEI